MTNIHSIEVQAHRGARDFFPENTLPAFEAAWKMGAGLIELDIQITSDGIPVIYHDFAINPDLCCYMDGSSITKAPLIRSLSLSEVKNIDCGLKPDPRFKKQTLLPGTQIPTLEELIDAITQQMYLTPAGPSAVGPTNISDFGSIKSKLNNILSKLNQTS